MGIREQVCGSATLACCRTAIANADQVAAEVEIPVPEDWRTRLTRLTGRLRPEQAECRDPHGRSRPA
jgi:hypothetical protein